MSPTPRFQIALIAANHDTWRDFVKFADALNNETHLARVRDFPNNVDASTAPATATKLLADNKIPFAVVAITGNDREIEQSQVVFTAIRKKAPSTLVMCPRGYGYMSRVTDIPSYALSSPPHAYGIRMSILLGEPGEFAGYDEGMFGKALHFARSPSGWGNIDLTELAAEVRSVAYPDRGIRAKVTC